MPQPARVKQSRQMDIIIRFVITSSSFTELQYHGAISSLFIKSSLFQLAEPELDQALAIHNVEDKSIMGNNKGIPCFMSIFEKLY